MILYFANRKMQILGQASTTLPDGFVIQEDLKTEDVESGVSSFECTISYATESRSQIEEMMKAGNYILRSHDGENEFYTIIDYESDVKEQTVTVYAEDAGLDLLNEIAGKFENETAYNAAWYINKYIVDSGFEIGINEIPFSSVRTLSWDGESTVTERLASIANSFGGYEVSYSFEIDGLEVRRKFINFHAERGKNESAQLRLNREIDNIRTTQSISNLATALRVTGGVPETDGTDEETPPITLVGYKYDDGDIFVGEDGILRSREALKKWSRYIWNNEPGLVGGAYEGHIAKFFTYETTDQAELCAHAVTELKRVCDMEVNYEIDINRLPDDVKIGDRVDVVDEAGELFLSTRILVLETSIVDQTQKATLGEYLIRSHGISEKVLKMAENLTSVARSAARAKQTAIYAKSTAEMAKANSAAALEESEAAKAQATDAYNESLAANTKADEAKEQASQATQSATSATDKANSASASVEQIQAQVTEMDKDITAAQTAAQNAQEAAETADAKADAANTAAQNAQTDATAAGQAAAKAQTDATSAISKADTAQGTADDAKGKAEAAQQEVEAIKQDVAAANEELDKFVEDLDSLSNTMQADYARKTELSETEASLQSQISQNAGQIASVVSKQQTVDETISDISDKADQAQAAAEAAQAQADTATADAAKAQADATAAATAAQNAQSEADKAKTAAATAQSAADTANSELATAKANLASVTSRVDATEEEIAEAQKAVEDAQSAADKAQADATAAANAASAAQSMADTAKTNASTAQTAADTAAANAATAQTKANEAYTEAYNAKVAADNAQGDATAAQQTADEAKTAANTAQQTADEAKANAATAQSTANTAKNNAATAQAKANEAAEAADAAQSAADAADAKAAAAQSDLDTAKANLADVTSRVGATEEEIAAAQEAVETAQAAADKAKEDAAAAQSTANTAKANAATAQTAANNAKTAADNAQKAADDAQEAADAAQDAVDALAVRVTNAETSITQNSEEIALRAKKSEVETALGGYYKKTETDALIKVESDKIASQATQISSQGTRISTLEQNAEGFTARLDGIDEKATNAQKVATNYLNFSNSGLVIGDMTASTLGNNVLIDSDSVDIRNGETILASFDANKIALGKNRDDTIIELCNSHGTINYDASDEVLYIKSFRVIGLNSGDLYVGSDDLYRSALSISPPAATIRSKRINWRDGSIEESYLQVYSDNILLQTEKVRLTGNLESTGDVTSSSGSLNNLYSSFNSHSANSNIHLSSDEKLYLSGLTGNIQTQLDGKSESDHAHAWSEITSKPSTFTPASHSHAWSEITSKPSTFTPSSHSHTISDVSGLQSALDGKVNKRMFGYVYSDVACNYYGSNMSNYWRITIPVQAYVWSMLTLELTVKQTYDVGRGGKIIINAYHSGSDLYFYGFNATTLGTLGTSIAVYGSDNSYFYIGGCAGYSTLSVDKIIVGDAAVSLDLSNVIVDSVSSLPSAYQTATMYYGVNAVGGYVMAKNGIKIDDKLAVSIDDSSDGWLRLNNTDAFASGVYLGGRGAKVIGTFTCTSLSQTSSEEYKTNIIPYEENAIAKVMNAVVYSYNLINELEDGLDYKQYGFIIEREIPKEFVSADGKGVNLYNMIAILTKAIQEQQIHISELSKEIEALKAA